jgi:propionyl-CoA carboxylase alpha chain
VSLDLTGEGLIIRLDDGRSLMMTDADWRPGQPQLSAILDGRPYTAEVRKKADGYVIRHRAARERVRVLTPEAAAFYGRLPERKAADTGKLIVSPMPGLVVSVDVEPGQEVKAGQAVAVIEAMKMQNIIRAERDATVKAVGARPGDSVAADEVLIEFA